MATGSTIKQDFRQDHRGQDRSTHTTHIAGDQISAARDAHIIKYAKESPKPGEGKHRRTWQGWEHQ